MINTNLIKLKNIFDSFSQPSPTNPNMGVAPSPINQDNGSDIMSRIAELLQPKEDQFNKLTSLEVPNRENFQPSMMRKIAAFTAGLGGNSPMGMWGGVPVGLQSDNSGLDLQDTILNQPYNKAVADFKLKLDPITEAAKLEGSRNTTNRMIGSDILRDERERTKLAETERKNKETEAATKQRIDISRSRAESYTKAKEWAMQHPTYEGKTDKDGKLVYINKTNPNDIVQTNIDTGDLSDIEKSELNFRNAMSLVSARGEETRNTNKDKAETGNWTLFNTKDEAGKDITVRINNATGEVKPVDVGKLVKPSGGSNPPKPEPPTQDRVRVINKANEVKLLHPEWTKYITIKDGNVEVKSPGGMMSGGPTKEVYDQIVAAISGGSSKSTTNGKTLVKRKSDGKVGYVTNPDMTIYDLVK